MKRRAILTLSTGLLLAGGFAAAGINPASPGLPSVNDARMASRPVANNGGSAMCVDCHTQNPKLSSGMGTHYINTALNGSTNSGGSGIDSGNAITTRDNGAYFKLTLWNAAGATGASYPSKYANLEVSTVFTAPLLNGSALTTNRFNAALNATASAFQAYDVICESCHNVVGNDDGGNNLLESIPTNNYQAPAIADICVGCHGFMYSANANIWTATQANVVNDTDGRNANEATGTTPKGNNEWHWIRGTAYQQNHHVMSGDAINPAMATVGALWTDNVIVAYSSAPVSNAATWGTYPQRGTWYAGSGMVKPTTGTNPAVNCTNCHTQAHGNFGSPAASILRGGAYTGTAPATTWSRISDRAAWKKIDDLNYCNQCHQ